MNDPQPAAPPLDYSETLQAIADLDGQPVKVEISSADNPDRALVALRGFARQPRPVGQSTEDVSFRVMIESSEVVFDLSEVLFERAEQRSNGLSVTQRGVTVTIDRDFSVE